MHITEQVLISSFVGKSVNRNLSCLFRESSGEHRLCISSMICGENFGVTHALREYWDLSGISLDLVIRTEQGVIVSGFVDKLRCAQPGHGRPAVRVLKPSQQELRIVRRLLHFVTDPCT